MKAEYDFTNARKNPYTKKLKQQITINLSGKVVTYFKNMSAESGIPYQTLIDLYLSDCAENNRKIDISWR